MGDPNSTQLLAIQYLNGIPFLYGCSGQKQKKKVLNLLREAGVEEAGFKYQVFPSCILQILYSTLYFELREKPIKTPTIL